MLERLSQRDALLIRRAVMGQEYGFHYCTAVPGTAASSVRTVAANASNTGQIQVESGADMVIESITTVVLYALTNRRVNPTTDPMPRISIQDGGSKARLMNRDDNPVGVITGSAEFPYFYRLPLRLEASSTLEVTWFNINTTLDYKIQTMVHGYKIPTRPRR